MMRRGFSLIELMIAIGLSSFIMLGMIQGYRNAIRLQRNAQNLLTINRRIALLFNQIERDITTAVVYRKPIAYQPADPKLGQKKEETGEAKKEEAEKPAEQKNGKKEKQEKPVPCIQMEIFDDEMYKHRGKKWQTTKKFSLLTTTPLEVFGAEQVHLVRAGYELTPDKKQSTGQRQVYSLVRKQTPELKNVGFKQDENAKEKTVASHVVAQNIKHMSLQATYVPKPPKNKDGQPEKNDKKPDPVRTFAWAEKQEKESSTGLPEYLNMHIELWDDQFEKSYSFECLMPFFVRDEIEPRKDDAQDAKDNAGAQTPPQEGAAPAAEQQAPTQEQGGAA